MEEVIDAVEAAKDLDQFYTNPKIAERFVKKVDELYDLSSYDHVIEPSMGEGFIYNHFPVTNRIGLDIEKNHPDCLEGNFLKWKPEKSGIEYEPLLGKNPKIAFAIVVENEHSAVKIAFDFLDYFFKLDANET